MSHSLLPSSLKLHSKGILFMATKGRVLLLGATGQLGKHILASLQAATHPHVTLLVRTPEKLGANIPSHYKIVKGEINDTKALKEAFDGVTTVIMAAGRPDVVDEPGKPPSSLKALFRIVLDAVLAEKNPPRLLCMGGLGILDAPGSGYVYQLPGFPAIPKGYSVVHNTNIDLLRSTKLDWTLFCPGFMVEQDKGNVAVTFEHAPFFSPNSYAGSLLSYLHGVFSTISLALFKNSSLVNYGKVADVIVGVALDLPSTGGFPLSEYNHKRIGFYNSA